MNFRRREMLKQSGLAAMTFVLASGESAMTATEARAADVPYRTLNRTEVQTLDALGETLLPGAADAGISHYIDQQISIAPTDALMVLRYLDVPPPFARFYQAGLAALDALARTGSGVAFADLPPDGRTTLVRTMARPGNIAGWSLPFPAVLFYFALRSDAVDVVYGTVEGFKRLYIPYLPHIVPEKNW